MLARELEPLLTRLDPLHGRDRAFALRFWDGSEIPATDGEPLFRIHVRSQDAFAYLLHAPGELGLGRAWVSGALDVEGDLDQALALMRERLDGGRASIRSRLELLAAAARVGGLRRPPIPESEARPRGRLHSLRRDSQAVRHHYDVPTDFYRLVLGPSLVYSCAYFESPDMTLAQAQEAKLDLICRKLDLRDGERLLDVGCGWGSLVLHAAERYGVDATGVTLSPSQADEARRRIAEAGLGDRCRVEVLDYRALHDGSYDKIASVGMYEHVGREELPRYASTLAALLRPGGALLNHGIARVRPARDRIGPFIDRYVFPDGDLQPVGQLLSTLEAQQFELRHIETLREHYAITLRCWVANLAAHREEAIRIAGAERERVWRLYMTGAAQAFERGELGVYQTLAQAPGGMPAPRAAPVARTRPARTRFRGRARARVPEARV